VIPFVELSLKVMAQIGAGAIKSLTPLFAKKIGCEVAIKSPKIISSLLTLSGLPYISAKQAKHKLPESLFFEISRFVKEQKKIPASITVDLGEEARKFYEKNRDLIDAHVSDTQSQLKSAHLVWKAEWDTAGHMTMFLVNAEFRKNLNNKLLDFGQKPRIRFSETGFGDIAGQKQVKVALKEIIDLLGKTELIEKFRIKPPRGILLFGPEGVGKLTLAQAFCKEANMPYISVSTTELFNQSYVKHIYQVAKSHAPMVIILQGVDMQGYVEGMVTTVPTDPITEMIDTLSSHEMVFTIATAVGEQNVNPDLTKSGMIDIRVEVPELDREARRFYIQQILKKPNDGKIDIDRVVRYISGMSRDELERLDREVAINAIKKSMSVITEALVIEQINIIKYGQKLDAKKVKNFEEELKMTAYHEAGHAVLSHILLPDIKIEQVTITPRSDALGFVSYSSEDYESNVTKEELFNNVCVLLAGRIAKLKQFGESKGLDSGAMSDLEQATTQVYLAITMLGMDEELGMISMGSLDSNMHQIFGRRIEERMLDWLSRAKIKTELMVLQHWEKIETLAQKLIENEVVEGEELEAIIGKA
jgi:ATP-dependent Zn protease